MKAQNVSHRTSATQSNESPTSGGRDARKGAHDDASSEDANTPPVHRTPTHGVSRFLWVTDPETPIESLSTAYSEWQGQSGGRGE